MTQLGNLLIVGASARAAAQSARRAGFEVTAIDLFADEDLAACAKAIRCDDYPGGLVELAARAADGPWMYTGGLENHPQVVERIAASRPLWGNGGCVLRRVRDPLAVHAALVKAGLPALDVSLDPADLPRDGDWLAKPLSGSGGKLVHVLDAASPALHAARRAELSRARWYFQRRQAGMPASAVYVARSGRGHWLGISEQLVGRPWTTAGPFQYAGSIFPLPDADLLLDENFTAELRALGDTLAGEFGLVGLFGVDGVIRDRRFWPVEVNPRYTASCELIERFAGPNLVRLHASACDDDVPRTPLAPRCAPHSVGKAIVFARSEATFTERAAAWVARLNAAAPRQQAADIPPIGTRFALGDPVLTLLVEVEPLADVRGHLRRLADDLLDRLV